MASTSVAAGGDAPENRLLIPGEKGVHSGIPEAVFLEDIDSFMKGETAEDVLKRLDEQHQKFKFMLSNFDNKKKRLKGQIPDITTTLESVKHLKSKRDGEPMETKFLLSDQVYAKAVVPPTSRVCLWLGANTMLEYDIDEAEELLVKNLGDAKTGLATLEDDMDYLRDQITTTEVNMARIYNWNVKNKKDKGEPVQRMGSWISDIKLTEGLTTGW